MALSKRKGSSIAALNEVRHIQINSHLAKVMEKAIANKLIQMESKVLHTRLYQAGFKKGQGTA